MVPAVKGLSIVPQYLLVNVAPPPPGVHPEVEAEIDSTLLLEFQEKTFKSNTS